MIPSRAPILCQIETSRVIREHFNLLLIHFGAPDSSHQYMGKKFEIRYVKLVEVFRGRHRDVFVTLVVIGPDAWSSTEPARRTSVQRNDG